MFIGVEISLSHFQNIRAQGCTILEQTTKIKTAVAGHTNCDTRKTFLFFHVLFFRLWKIWLQKLAQNDVRMPAFLRAQVHVSQNLRWLSVICSIKYEMSQHPRAKHIHGRNSQKKLCTILGRDAVSMTFVSVQSLKGGYAPQSALQKLAATEWSSKRD